MPNKYTPKLRINGEAQYGIKPVDGMTQEERNMLLDLWSDAEQYLKKAKQLKAELEKALDSYSTGMDLLYRMEDRVATRIGNTKDYEVFLERSKAKNSGVKVTKAPTKKKRPYVKKNTEFWAQRGTNATK